MSIKTILRAITTMLWGILISILPFNSIFAQDNTKLVINYIESQPVEGKFEYDVSVFFSLVDNKGNPIGDLQTEDITISEDGQTTTLDTLGLVTDQPIYISLLLDTSGSMRGPKNEELIKASNEFVNGLNKEDNIAVTTFNSEIKSLVDFSTDHAAATNLISSIEAIANSGTCLFDAAYEAVQKTAALPIGRRAVILLTDGKDELLSGGACSKLTIDDVINIATEGNVRVPIFTIGIGDSVDEASLSRIAQLTGGTYSHTPDPAELNILLAILLDLLQSQYELHYTSTAAPGSHIVVINAKHKNINYTDSHGFILPALPLNLSIVSPVNGQLVTDKTMIVIEITGKGEPIKQVEFNLDDTIIGEDQTTPYELEWQPNGDLDGEYKIHVKAIGENDQELASASVVITVILSEELAPSEPETSSITGFQWNKYLPYASGLLLAILVAVGMIIVIKSRKKKTLEYQRDARWNQMVVNPLSVSDGLEERTMDGFLPNSNAVGSLTVLQSDDPVMIGKKFEIFDSAIRLGRAEDNEIRFAKDSPVSRRHAIIEHQNDRLVISEMITPVGDGTVKTPTFGTYVNEVQISRLTELKNGDVIKLGKRVVLRLESTLQDFENDAKTIDQFDQNDSEKTIDSF